MMRVHCLQHVAFEGLGGIEPWLTERGYRLSCSRLYAGEPLPKPDDFDWLIVIGGPMGANDEDVYPWLAAEKTLISQWIDAGKRVLGLGLGAQLIAASLGAMVCKNEQREIGWFPIERTAEAMAHPLGRLFPSRSVVFQWHGDTFALPVGAVRLASSEACRNQAFAIGDQVLALQFHLHMTPAGAAQLVEQCDADLKPGPFVQAAERILGTPEDFQRINALLVELLHAFA